MALCWLVGKLETLDIDIFEIEKISSVINRLNIDNDDPKTKTVLLTARLPKFKSNVENLFTQLNIHLDDLTFKTGNLEKDERILNYIKDYPDIKEIDVYDDREKEFKILLNLKSKLENETNIKMTIYKVDGENISEL